MRIKIRANVPCLFQQTVLANRSESQIIKEPWSATVLSTTVCGYAFYQIFWVNTWHRKSRPINCPTLSEADYRIQLASPIMSLSNSDNSQHLIMDNLTRCQNTTDTGLDISMTSRCNGATYLYIYILRLYNIRDVNFHVLFARICQMDKNWCPPFWHS